MDNLVFDLKNVSDLSEKFRKELKILNMRDDTMKVLELFDIKNRLSIDEILVGLYRLHKMEKTRVWVSSTLYNLGQRNLIKKVKGKKGEYEKEIIDNEFQNL